jgi:heme/copper-type cytochrome/quinol oxidase subunit 2
MRLFSTVKTVLLTTVLSAGGQEIWACSTCYGAPDDPTTVGIQLAVMSMLGVIVIVLGAIATFMISLWRKSQLIATSDTKTDKSS